MKSIWQALRDGDAKTRLAVIADLVSIVGISIATVAGALFTLKGQLHVDAVAEFLVVGLLSIAGAATVLALFMVISFYISNFFDDYPAFKKLLLFALWTAFAALTVAAGYIAYKVLENMPQLLR